jgi:hypothetical protein
MLRPIAMKLGTYIMPPEALSTAYFINPPISNTNTEPPQIAEVTNSLLLEPMTLLGTKTMPHETFSTALSPKYLLPVHENSGRSNSRYGDHQLYLI